MICDRVRAWVSVSNRSLVLGQGLFAGRGLGIVILVVLDRVHEVHVVAGLAHHLGTGLAHKRRVRTERLETQEEERAHQVLAVLTGLAHVQHELGALQTLLGELQHGHEAVLGRLWQNDTRQLHVQGVVVQHLEGGRGGG